MSRGVTLKDVAGRAGVSVITASRAINGTTTGLPVSAETRKRVEDAAASLGYRPSTSGRNLRDRRTRQIGAVLINNPAHPVTNLAAFEYLLGINAGLSETGYLLTQVRMTDLAGQPPEQVRVLRERALDGLIAVSRMSDPICSLLQALHEPVLWLDTVREIDGPLIRRDEVHAGRTAAGMLIAAGRRRIIWLQRPRNVRNHYSHDDRESGARAACAGHGIPFLEHDGSPGSGIGDLAGLIARLREPGTGLLLSDRSQAHWCVATMAMHGLVPGRDLGIACCDSDRVIDDSWPELSRVGHDRHAIGLRSAGLIVDLVEGRPIERTIVVAGDPHPGSTA